MKRVLKMKVEYYPRIHGSEKNWIQSFKIQLKQSLQLLERNTEKSPTSIGIIAWSLIIIGICSAIMTIFSINGDIIIKVARSREIPAALQFCSLYSGFILMITCGFGILNGKNWARILYILWNLAGFSFSIMIFQPKTTIISNFMVFMVILYFLFQKKTNHFFRNDD